MESDETEADGQDKTHLHRPMNAFLLFCKQHRPIVREKYPIIENRAVTKILGEWWSNLAEEEKSPYTSLAHQYKEAFMKANPEFRWHKMPPGTADSLPPSGGHKPSTPSPANGLACPAAGLLPSSSDSSGPESSPSACAPKPFKKRYLASQAVGATWEPAGPASSLSSAGVSPEAARACEALMELARNESCGSRSSEGSERRVSPSETPPLQTLREAVWSKVAGTLLQQEEDKLVPPPKDCPMNLTNQCTIRGQQIIEHIIENILSTPMNGPMDPTSEQITFSVNNNQEHQPALPSPARPHPALASLPNGDVGDSIKASIYESLKNDLLKGKVTPILPVSGPGRPAPKPSTSPSSSSSPAVSPGSAARKAAAAGERRASPPAASSPPSGQDVLRLLGSGQLPINVGNSAITITKTPRVSLAQTSSTPATSFPVSSLSSSPVSLSLTRTGPSRGFPASFSLNGGVPVLLSPQSLVLSSPGSLVLSGLPGRQVQGGDCVLLQPVPGQQQVLLGPASAAQQHLLLAGTKLVLGPAPSTQPGPDPVNMAVASRTTTASHRAEPAAAKRPLPAADPIGEERRSSRTGRGRRYQEFIEDISSTKKKRRSHRSGEETSEPEGELEPLQPTEAVRPLAPSSPRLQHHVHWKKMRTAGLGPQDAAGARVEPSPSKPPLANQETPTANPQFDLDAKMEKMEPLKFPDSFAKGKGSPGLSKPAGGSSSRCSARQAQHDRAAASTHPGKAFESRFNKKSR